MRDVDDTVKSHQIIRSFEARDADDEEEDTTLVFMVFVRKLT